MGATAPRARPDLMFNSLRQSSQGLHQQLPHQLPHPLSHHQQAQHQNLSQNHQQLHEQGLLAQKLQQQPRQQVTQQVTQHRPLTQTLGRHNLSAGDIDPFVTSLQFRNQLGASGVVAAPGGGGVGGIFGKGLGYSSRSTVSTHCSAGLPGAGEHKAALTGASSWESVTSGPTWGTQQLHGVSHSALGADQAQGLQVQGLQASWPGQTQARYLLEEEHPRQEVPASKHGAGADFRQWHLKQHMTHKQHLTQHMPSMSTNFTAIGEAN